MTDRIDPLQDDNTNDNAADFMFGEPGLPTGTITKVERIKKLSIFEIVPDPAQPRRVLPNAIRRRWNKRPDGAKKALLAWLKAANQLYDPTGRHRLKFEALLDGTQEVVYPADENGDDLPLHPVVINLLELVGLARDILRDGQLTPAYVIKYGNGYQLESGERRWWALHMLRAFADGDKTINTFVKDKPSIARQAAENSQRAPLNAIETARQLALVIMALIIERDGDTGQFRSYAEIEAAGEHELVFYRQVEDLNTPRGQQAILLDKTGLPNKRMVSAYRKLWTLPEGIWDKADDENWTEFALRPHIKTEDKSPAGDLSQAKPADSPLSDDNRPAAESDDNAPIGESDADEMQPNAPVPVFRVGDKVRTPNGSEGTIDRVRNDIAWVRSGNKVDRYLPEQLALVEVAKPALAPVARFTPPGMETGTGTPEPDRSNPTPRQKPGTSVLTGKPAPSPEQPADKAFLTNNHLHYHSLSALIYGAEIMTQRSLKNTTAQDIMNKLDWIRGMTQQRASTLAAHDKGRFFSDLDDVAHLTSVLLGAHLDDVEASIAAIKAYVEGGDA